MNAGSKAATHGPATTAASPSRLRDHCLAPDRIDAPPDALGRYGRMFDLPALECDEHLLHGMGMPGGFCDGGKSEVDASVEAGWPFFGQYVAHDLTADRSPLREHVELGALGNMRSPRANLESLYGGGPVGSPYLYQRADPAKLLEGDDDVPRNAEGVALIGDPRNDTHVFMSQMQLAFLRAHNRLVDRLRGAGSDESDLFDAARRALTWHYQWVIVNDFLPKLIGTELVAEVLTTGPRHYRPEGTLFIPVEFADAAYRYGHSQIRQTYLIRANGPQLAVFPDLAGLGPVGDRTVDWALLFDVPGRPPAQRAKQIDGTLPRSLLDLPQAITGELSDSAYASLATRDLQRGQGTGLPSGETVARHIGADVLDAAELGLASRGWDAETPLWLYVLREAAVRHDGDRLGEVGGRIAGEVLISVIARDPESYLALHPNWRPVLPAYADDFKLRDVLVPVERSARFDDSTSVGTLGAT